MTKKDYELIASVVAGLPPLVAKAVVVGRLGYALWENNPRFDWEKFLDACMGKEKGS